MSDENDRRDTDEPDLPAEEGASIDDDRGGALSDFNFVAAKSESDQPSRLPDLENRDALFDYDIVPDDELLPDSEKRLAKRSEAMVAGAAPLPPSEPESIVGKISAPKSDSIESKVVQPEFIEPDFSISDAEDAEYTHTNHEEFELSDYNLTSLDDDSPRIMPASVKRPPGGWLLRLAGHLAFSAIGLIAGYYILCWLNPRGNFLHLDLPGLHISIRDWLGR